MAARDADRYQKFGRPLFYEAYAAVAADAGFVRNYPLDVAPQSDDRPFPNRFLRWVRIRDFAQMAGLRFQNLLLSTELVGGAVLVLSVGGAALLLGMPFPLLLRRDMASRDRSLAWAANGCASVLASSAAALVAAAAGLSMLLVLAGACSLLACLALLMTVQPPTARAEAPQ